jgi:GNAT superfamily N-acetyltransferase
VKLRNRFYPAGSVHRVDVRSLKEDPGLAGAIRELLNLTLHKDFVDRRFFRRITVEDPNFDPKLALACVAGGRVVAAAIGVVRTRAPEQAVEQHKHVAWIKALAADPGAKGVLRDLVGVLEGELAREGRRHVRVSDYASWYLAPGVDLEYDWLLALLAQAGYRKVGEAVNYEVDMSAFYYPERVRSLAAELERRGVEVRKAGPEDRERVGKWVEEKFSPFWRTEVEMALAAEDGGVLVAESGGAILGFSAYGALRPDFFGPIGVDPSARGGGIGTVLLFETLKLMRAEGVRVATIPWTTHLTFYAQVPGVCRVRPFAIMAKDLA